MRPIDDSPNLQRVNHALVARPRRHSLLAFIMTWVVAAVVFLLVPGSVADKTFSVLHGLCAQQPDHSFFFGVERLPFDARMTGIYGGFAATSLALLVRGRWRSVGIPDLRIAAILASFIVVLGIDGVNSTLHDLGAWYLYSPHNVIRLATGLLTGITLSTFIWVLVGQVAFHPGARSSAQIVTGICDLGLIVLINIAFGIVVLVRPAYLFAPLALVLLVSAVTALAGLMIALVLLVSRSENQATTTVQLAGPATAATLIAFLMIGILSGGRFALEAWLDIAVMSGGGGS